MRYASQQIDPKYQPYGLQQKVFTGDANFDTMIGNYVQTTALDNETTIGKDNFEDVGKDRIRTVGRQETSTSKHPNYPSSKDLPQLIMAETKSFTTGIEWNINKGEVAYG